MLESIEALEGDTYEAQREDQVHLMVLSSCLARHLTRKDEDIEKVGSYEEVKQFSERILEYIERCSHTSQPKAVEARTVQSYWPSEPDDRVALVTAALQQCEADDDEGHDGWREALKIWTGQSSLTNTEITTDYLRKWPRHRVTNLAAKAIDH